MAKNLPGGSSVKKPAVVIISVVAVAVLGFVCLEVLEIAWLGTRVGGGM
jgi:hypothetical protein